ncbi:MAG: hypothetical protein ABW039_03920 [Sphingobium sp.]
MTYRISFEGSGRTQVVGASTDDALHLAHYLAGRGRKALTVTTPAGDRLSLERFEAWCATRVSDWRKGV